MRPNPLLLGLALFFSALCSFATDTHTPTRIVTLAPSLGELASEILETDLQYIVGVSEYTDYPPALINKPTVGSYSRLNIEKISMLKPDLILATKDGNSKDEIQHLKELGFTVIVVETGTIAQISDSFVTVAKALNRPEKGAHMKATLLTGIEKLRNKTPVMPRKKILIQVGDDPLVVAGGGSFLNEILEILGVGNLYSDLAQNYPRTSREDILSRRPDAVFVMEMGTNHLLYKKMQARWLEYGLNKNQVRLLKCDSLMRPSLRLLEGVAVFKKEISQLEGLK